MVDATIKQNVITVSARNIASVRFYLNDQMVDFTRATSVVIGGRRLFEDLSSPTSIRCSRTSFSSGRGWRYYTAVIDIDRGPPDAPTTRPTAE